MPRENIHTVFDRMAAKGIFRANPANIDSVDPMTGQPGYQGPVPFPKMLYHPTGKTRIVVNAEAVNTPFGPTMNNEQRTLITKTVDNELALAAAIAEGWHEHPSDSVAAGFTKEQIEAGAVPPPKGAANRINSLESEVERLTKELAKLKASPATIQDDSAKNEDDE
jgi:hypothetical protein